jgi:rsbT co-antagonist protein RsbR
VSEQGGRRARAPGATGEAQRAAIKAQQATIEEQRRALSEVQTPVIQVWDGVLALPIVGSLDTARAQEMTEALLERVVQTGSEIVLLDITAVPVVDTSVAKHLMETVAAARLLGAEVLVVGLSTRTALTLVHLGIDLAGVTTRTTLAKGLELAFARLGLEVVRRREGRPGWSGWSGAAEPGWLAPPGAGDREAEGP